MSWLGPHAVAHADGRMSFLNEDAFYPLMGVAGLLLCLSAGFWIAGMITGRWYRQDDELIPGQNR